MEHLSGQVDAAITGWSWLALRLFALLQAQAVWRAATGAIWPWIAAGLAMSAAAAWSAPASGPVAWEVWLVGAGFEVLLGAVVGLIVGLPGEALVGAAGQSGAALGLTRTRAWTLLQAATAGSLALALGLHRPLLAGLRSVATRWPVGDPLGWEMPLDVSGIVGLAGDVTALALGLATPALLTVALAELVLAGCSRGATLTATLAALRPLATLWLGLAAYAAAWASYPEAWLRSFAPP